MAHRSISLLPELLGLGWSCEGATSGRHADATSSAVKPGHRPPSPSTILHHFGQDSNDMTLTKSKSLDTPQVNFRHIG